MAELLASDAYLGKIPTDEQWNLFFTVANCTKKKREFESQNVICFDLDKIDNTQHEKYIEIFCKTLGVKQEETGIVFSGNGLHFYIGLQVPIVDKKYFTTGRVHYGALLAAIDRALKEAGLPGESDPAVWDARRIMRLPGTWNKKPGKEDKRSSVIQANITPTLFDITVASGIPVLRPEDAIPKGVLKKYPKTDNVAIFEGCNFLKFCRDEQEKVSEPQWYAALSITARMENGDEVSHNISKNHRGYSREITDAKISHALTASPPRKCASIDSVWGGCKSCPNFEKVESPIMLRSSDKLKTEDTGFHDIVTLKTGGIKYVPNYEDLLKAFERDNYYVSHSKICWKWTGTHFEAYENALLENYAQTKFNPFAKTAMTKEFQQLVLRTNPVSPMDWQHETIRKINFPAGYFDAARMEFIPRTTEKLGFKNVLPYDYDSNAKAPVFEAFLEDIMCGDKNLKMIVEEFMGYALSGDSCKGAKALFLVGEGSNGKSTLIRVLKALVGEKSYTTLSLKDLGSMERCHALDGSLFNIAEETPDKVADSSPFKNLVDGGEIEVRKLFADNYRIFNRAKLFFILNAIFSTRDNSYGYKRRLLIVPFNKKYTDALGNKDADLDEKLFSELPGIFNIVMQGYARYVKNGKRFTGSAVADNEIETYTLENDPIRMWAAEYLTVVPIETQPHCIKTMAMYKNFLNYWDATQPKNNNIPPLTVFGRRLRVIVPELKDRESKDNNIRGFFGIKLKDDVPY